MIYRYKATLKGNKNFLREFELKPEMKLYRLHQFIQQEFEFTPDQMVLFEGVREDKGYSEYGLFDMGQGSMDSISLKDVLAKEENTLRYIYNMNGSIYLILEFLEETTEMPKTEYPRIAFSRGQNPDQFSDTYEDLTEAAKAMASFGGKSEEADEDDEDADEDAEEEIFDENELNTKDED